MLPISKIEIANRTESSEVAFHGTPKGALVDLVSGDLLTARVVGGHCEEIPPHMTSHHPCCQEVPPHITFHGPCCQDVPLQNKGPGEICEEVPPQSRGHGGVW